MRQGFETQMPCPVCRSEKTYRVRVIDVEPVIELWRHFFEIDIKPEFRGFSQMELWSCVDCSVLFFAPQCLAGSAKMYAQLASHGGYYVARKWEYDAALSDLRGRQRILEVGCGSGSFMVLAKEEAGLPIEGVEQNSAAISEAARRGLRVREATVEEAAKESPGVYDAVCGFQVFEHIARPKEFLDACCTLLRPGGLLILGVPNQDSYVRHMLIPLDMPPHHMTRWTRKSLHRLQTHFPLKLARTACEPLGDNQIEHYVDTYFSLVWRGKFGFLLHPWLYSRAIRLIRYFRLQRFIRGQNIYACFVRS